MIAPETELIIFDADGTLRYVTVPGQHYPLAEEEQRLMPGVVETMARLPRARLKFGIASNQHGVALGQITRAKAHALLSEIWRASFFEGAPPVAIEMCTCLPDATCSRRKPMPGMLLALLEKYAVCPQRALYVGDLSIDAEAAQLAEIPFRFASEFFAAR